MPDTFSARVLLFRRPDGTVEPYLPFIEYQMNYWRLSRSWQDSAARALGLFWDFCVVHVEKAWKPQEMLRQFAMTLLEGTINRDCDPATAALMWPSVPLERTRGLIKRIEEFAEWCASKYDVDAPLARDFVPLNPRTGEGMARLLTWGHLRRLSMLQHLKQAPAALKKSGVHLGKSSSKGKENEPVKHFPAKEAERLLWEGYKRPGAATEPNDFLRYNVRDMMIALLDGWGGLRRSEGLHLWCGDVRPDEDPHRAGQALVVLSHPEEGPMEYDDPFSGVRRVSTRKETLNRLYRLRPRNVVKRGSYHVGWKGMALNSQYQSCIFWIDPQAGALFWVLYQGYMRHVRPAVMAKRIQDGGGDHPFLFVSEEVNAKTGLVGEPYSEKAYERNHNAAVKRIGLECGKMFGTSTHGLRHLYGQTMEGLNVPAQVIRAGMHHISVLSHLAYTVPMAQKVNDALREAQTRIVGGHPIIAPLTGDTTRELLRLRGAVNYGALFE